MTSQQIRRTDLDLVSEIERHILIEDRPLDATELRMDKDHVQEQYARHRET